jgi:cysteinyl-tRNA synthetase
MAFRLLVLESHYHSESNFSWDILQAANNRYKNWLNYCDTIWQLPESDDISLIEELNNCLADNIDTPRALRQIELYFESVFSDQKSPNKKVINHILESLGLDLQTCDISKEAKELLKKRELARKKKLWQESDDLRDKLAGSGIKVRDESFGQIWSQN